MPLATEAELVAALAETSLLDARQLDELTHSFQHRFPEPSELARQLTLNGWITNFQAGRLLQGKGRQLRIGSYVLLERLGEGGMGEVFKARDERLKRTVALKVIGNQHLARERMLERFRREAEAAARLTHPNIVTLYDAGEIGDTHFLAMEFIDGVDLARLLETTGPLPLSQACDFARQAALGLQHVHERGLVHRDVKPANLFVQPPARKARLTAPPPNVLAGQGTAFLYEGGTVKLLDLGMARLLGPLLGGKQGQITSDRTLVGTLDYLAPEQARDSHGVDGRADLYSLGCTLYHLLTGRPPYSDAGGIDKLIQQVSGAVPSIGAVRADVPAALDAVVARLMAKRPEDRYQTAGEVADALEPFTRPEIAAEAGKDGRPSVSAPTPVPPTVEMPAGQPFAPTAKGRTTAASGNGPLRPKCSWRLVARVGVTLVAAALVASLFRYGVPGTTEAMRPPMSGSYLPADTTAVIAVNVRQFHAAAIVQHLKAVGTVDRLAEGRVGGRLRFQFGYDPERDVDNVRVICGANGFDRPLYWVPGQFWRSRFRLDPCALPVLDEERFRPFTLYRSTNAIGSETTVATDGNALICCQDPKRVTDALHEVLWGCQPQLRNEKFQALYDRAGRQQTIWVAADLTAGRRTRLLTGDPLQDQLLAPLFAHAESVCGGIELGDDAEAMLNVEARDSTHADRLERALGELQRNCRKLAAEPAVESRLLPLLGFVAEADVKRKGTSFVLHFRLTHEIIN